MQVTIPRSMRDKLSYALALLSRAIPTGDVVEVLDRALDALIVKLEKRKFGRVLKKDESAGAPRPGVLP
jgi:hypothetical protein